MRRFLKQDVRVTPCLPRRSHRFCRSCERRDRIKRSRWPAPKSVLLRCSNDPELKCLGPCVRHGPQINPPHSANCRTLINVQRLSNDLCDPAKMMWSAKRAPAPRLRSNLMFSSCGAKAVVQASKNSGFLSSSILSAWRGLRRREPKCSEAELRKEMEPRLRTY